MPRTQDTLGRVTLPLREHRARVKVSLDTIIEQTKISRRFLEAIENGQYEQLPGGVFAVNYIKQYAALVGYDAELILDDYRRSQSNETAMKPPGKESNEPRWVRFFEFG